LAIYVNLATTMADQGQIPVTERAHYVANIFVAVTAPLLLLSLVLLSTRISVKLRHVTIWYIGWDDWFIVAGFVRTSGGAIGQNS
jgi:hypothetical protein